MKQLRDTDIANRRPPRKYSPEEIAAAEAALASKNSNCRPNCTFCGGVGFISTDAPIGSPEFGKVKTCPNKFQSALRAGATRYGLKADEVAELTWEMILPKLNTAQSVVPRIRALLSGDGDNPPGGLAFLYGSNGLAKSLILKIAVAESLRSGRQAVYCNMTDILSNVRLAFDTARPNEEAEMRLEFWQNIPVLAIDELNRINEKPWALEQRFSLLDARYQQAIRQESVTIIASNTPPEKQEDYLRSRLRDGRFVCVELTGADARPFMANGNHY